MANLGSNFYKKLLKITSELQMKPEDLLCIMVSESGINPGAVNPGGNAAGLIQFMPSTLKGLGYQGDYKDFIKLNGEAQLDWVKSLIQSNMRINNGPFTSAAQFYLSNLFPIALKLKGIKENDPSVKILEANPESVKNFSKKYLDVGVKISVGTEKAAYKSNKGLFDKENKGSITFGDLIRQTENNKKNPLYKKAIEELNKQTGYEASNTKQQYSPVVSPKVQNKKDFLSVIEKALKMIIAEKNITDIKKIDKKINAVDEYQLKILKILKKAKKL